MRRHKPPEVLGRDHRATRTTVFRRFLGRLSRDSEITLALGLTVLIWTTNALWLGFDSRPPVWDMALHQIYALNYLPSQNADAPASPLWSQSGAYPPFVHLVIAFFYLVFQPGPKVAALANLPATFLLLWAINRLGNCLAGPNAGRWACIMTALIPYLFWMSRETILDYWLSAWVAGSLVLLLQTTGFRNLRASLALGIVLALGLLTKWLFVAFLFFPILYVFLRERVWKEKRQLLACGLALLIAGLPSGFWYLPNLRILLRFFGENADIGAAEGEPPSLSPQSAVYYLRLLEGYQLFALLFLLLILSVGASLRRRLIQDRRFLAVALVGPWLILTLLRTKDPRFSMPLLGILMIFPGAWIGSWRGRWKLQLSKVLIVSVLCFQAYAINFGVSWLPEEVVLAEGYQGSLRWDWNLYLQHYFHILGPPRNEDWKQFAILQRFDQDAARHSLRRVLALVPDLPRFSATNFYLYARLLGMSCQVGRLTLTPEGIHPLSAVDYVLTTEGEQGMPWTTTTSTQLNQIIDASPVFELVERFPLPEGNFARLYRVTR